MPRTSNEVDVLGVISSLSNTEVFTPPKSVAAMLDMFPTSYWSDPRLLWLDPVSKTGVFLREVYERLMSGLSESFPDPLARSVHILSTMLLGICTSHLGALAARRTMFGTSEFAQSSASQIDSLHDFIFEPETAQPSSVIAALLSSKKKEFKNESDLTSKNKNKRSLKIMFDVIKEKRGSDSQPKVIVIGNPPYQEADGGHGASARPIYQEFFAAAQAIGDEVLFVIPSRWYAGGKGLNDFRKTMLHSKELSALVDFPDAKKVFPSNEIEGGVCFAHWKKNHAGLCKFSQAGGPTILRDLGVEDIFVRDVNALTILAKAKAIATKYMSELVSSRKPFGLSTNFDNFASAASATTLQCLTSSGMKFVESALVKVNVGWIPKWKVICSRADGAANKEDDSGFKRVLSKIKILEPNQICLETYLVLGTFNTKAEAESCLSFARSKVFRYLLSLRKIDQNMSKEKFAWIPEVQFTKQYTDQDLYSMFALSEQETSLIENSIAGLAK